MVRIRAFRLALSIPMILAFAGVIVAMIGFPSTEKAFLTGGVLFFLGVFLGAFLGLVVACPKCGKSRYAIGPFIGPFSLFSAPIPFVKCNNCGHDLAGREET